WHPRTRRAHPSGSRGSAAAVSRAFVESCTVTAGGASSRCVLDEPEPVETPAHRGRADVEQPGARWLVVRFGPHATYLYFRHQQLGREDVRLALDRAVCTA